MPKPPTYSLNSALPGHWPTVGRTQTGLTPVSPRRPTYGTTLRCSCGWTPRVDRRFSFGGEVRERPNARVSNEAPSRGGRKAAAVAYARHAAEAIERARAAVPDAG